MPRWIDPDLRSDYAVKSKCSRCGDAILRARAGRTAAVDVRLDPTPVLDVAWAPGRMLWCRKGRRILWRDHGRCDHPMYADHRCSEDDEVADDSDPFGTTTTAKHKSPYGGLLHPVTGKPIGRHVRVTNFIKPVADDYSLIQWQQRMMAKGLTAEDVAALATLDVSKDNVQINQICSAAKRAAGGDDAAALGTKLHKQTEYADHGQPDRLDPEWKERVKEYCNALRADEIIIIPSMIERKVCHTGLPSLVVGTFDRIVKLSDGSFVILDVKTGSLDPEKYMEKWLSIAAQLAIYADAVNDHGVWDPETQTWQKVPPVRTDIAIVAHLPAKLSGCTLYTVELDRGREALKAVSALRTARKAKGFVDLFTPPVTVDVAALADGVAFRRKSDELPYLIDTATTLSDLMSLVDQAKTLRVWNHQLSDAARARYAAIQNHA